MSFGGMTASPLRGKRHHGSSNVRGRLIPRYARACALRWVGLGLGLRFCLSEGREPEFQ